jgi:hypothetical protein
VHVLILHGTLNWNRHQFNSNFRARNAPIAHLPVRFEASDAGQAALAQQALLSHPFSTSKRRP